MRNGSAAPESITLHQCTCGLIHIWEDLPTDGIWEGFTPRLEQKTCPECRSSLVAELVS